MSRLLTKEDFGYYAVISAVVIVFSSFSETGIGAAIIQRKEIDKKFINNAFTLSLLIGVAISVLLLGLSSILARTIADESMKWPLMLMSITLLLNCMTSVNISIMYRRLQFLRVGVINLISLLLTSVIAVTMAYLGMGYYAILAKAILVAVFTCALSSLYCKTRYGLTLDRESINSIFRFSGWLMASVVFRNIAQQVDRLLMPKLLGVAQLGAYNRPKDFVNTISSKLNNIFDTALFPVLSSLQDNKNSLKNAFEKSFYLLNLFSSLLSLGFIVNSELIIRLFFGVDWLHLQSVLCLFALSILFNVDGRLADCYLRSLAMTKQQFYFRVVETVMKVLCVVIGSYWGMVGVAIAVVLADIAMKIVKTGYVAWKIDYCMASLIRTFLHSWKFLLVMVPCGILILQLFPHNLLGNILALLLFLIAVAVLFLRFPIMVGRQYKEEVFQKVLKTIHKR